MQKTMKYYKCISHKTEEEKSLLKYGPWQKLFTIGNIYLLVEEKEGKIKLKGKIDCFVPSDCFKEEIPLIHLFNRPVFENDVDGLLDFYLEGGFEAIPWRKEKIDYRRCIERDLLNIEYGKIYKCELCKTPYNEDRLKVTVDPENAIKIWADESCFEKIEDLYHVTTTFGEQFITVMPENEPPRYTEWAEQILEKYCNH